VDEIREESLAGSAGQVLLAGFAGEIAGLYPGWHPGLGPSAEPEDFAPPGGRFVVAYRDGRPAACGGLKRLDARTAEIKRLYVAPEARGVGIGRRVLERLEAVAAGVGYGSVRLDTGASQPEALALFRSAGYRPIADYNGNPFAAVWLEKPLG
jgi:GNAT superfamily N-acetyltransferase